MTQEEFIYRVLKVFADADSCGDLMWRCDGSYAPITFFVNCNDFFHWGCADSDDITLENLPELERAFSDAEESCQGGGFWGAMLFCARVRKMRPQGAVYPESKPELCALLDECGPERAVGLGNPMKCPSQEKG